MTDTNLKKQLLQRIAAGLAEIEHLVSPPSNYAAASGAAQGVLGGLRDLLDVSLLCEPSEPIAQIERLRSENADLQRQIQDQDAICAIESQEAERRHDEYVGNAREGATQAIVSQLVDLVHDFHGYVPGDHVLTLAQRVGVKVDPVTVDRVRAFLLRPIEERKFRLSRDEAEFIVDVCERTRIPQWMTLAAEIRESWGMAPFPDGAARLGEFESIAIKHATFLRRYLSQLGCAFPRSPDENGIFDVVFFLEALRAVRVPEDYPPGLTAEQRDIYTVIMPRIQELVAVDPIPDTDAGRELASLETLCEMYERNRI
jgi:hypothetical protein